jgi:hypothetical protein
MLLPMIGWTVTGAIFFLKPGYSSAYAPLRVKDYATTDSNVWIHWRPDWRELRAVSTVLGRHLLVRTAQGWSQLDPETLAPRPDPTEQEIRELVGDAISADGARYGEIVTVDAAARVATTSTGARVTLDWPQLALSQRGTDTDRIDFLYRIHYLQWTGSPRIDRILGVAGILFALTLAAFGARLLLLKPAVRA